MSAAREAWLQAEAQLADPKALAKAASKLPERQALMLRALQVLDSGERQAILSLSETCRESGQIDIALCLELGLLSAPQIDPSRLRREAKRQLPKASSPLPFLDLYRMMAVMATRNSPNLNKNLGAARQHNRLVDHLCLMASTSRPAGYLCYLDRDWPRASQTIAAATMACHNYAVTNARFDKDPAPRVIDWSTPNWDSLRASPDHGLLAWCARDEPFTTAHAHALDALRESAPRQLRESVARAFIARTYRELEQGTREWTGTLALQAAELVEPDRPALARTLEGCAEQIFAADAHPPSPELVRSLWAERARLLRAPEALKLARGLGEEGSPQQRVEVLSWLSVHDEVEQVPIHLQELYEFQTLSQIRRALAKHSPPPRRAKLLRALVQDTADRVIQGAKKLITSSPREACTVLATLTSDMKPCRETRRAIKMLVHLEPVIEPSWLLPLLGARERLPQSTVTLIQGWLKERRMSAVESAYVGGLVLRAGTAVQAKTLLRAERRALGSLPKIQALQRALYLLAAAHMSQDPPRNETAVEALRLFVLHDPELLMQIDRVPPAPSLATGLAETALLCEPRAARTLDTTAERWALPEFITEAL